MYEIEFITSGENRIFEKLNMKIKDETANRLINTLKWEEVKQITENWTMLKSTWILNWKKLD